MTDTRQTAVDFFGLAFLQKAPAVAADRFFGAEGYTQHNPEAPDGAEGFVGAISGLFSAFPDFTTEIKRVIVEDDLAVIHHHTQMNAEDAGSAVVDIFRVADGKIVEHWDVVQAVPRGAQNNNTMF